MCRLQKTEVESPIAFMLLLAQNRTRFFVGAFPGETRPEKVPFGGGSLT